MKSYEKDITKYALFSLWTLSRRRLVAHCIQFSWLDWKLFCVSTEEMASRGSKTYTLLCTNARLSSTFILHAECYPAHFYSEACDLSCMFTLKPVLF